MAVMPKVIKKIEINDKVIIHGGTLSKRLLRKISNSPRQKSGMKFSQNLLQRSERRAMGEVCSSQNALPSRLTAGKAKRMAMALRTKPASAKLANETILRIVPAGIGERSSGRTLKLYR